jgi:endonuclease I
MNRLNLLAALVVLPVLAGSVLGQDDWNAISLSDSVVDLGVQTTGITDSVTITLTNNLVVPVTVIQAAFEEDVFWADIGSGPIPGRTRRDVTIYFSAAHNLSYTDFLCIEMDHGIRPLVVEVSAEAYYPDSYYACTRNKWAEELKESLTALIDDHNSVGYTTARDSMYGHIDNVDGWVECVYTGRTAFFNTRAGAAANNFNCEHTWPQSFSGEAEPMRSDIFHLYPSDVTANSMRANLDFGIVTSVTWSVGGSKLGTDSEGQTVFEPRDVHKGNVARSHFYYIIRYDGNYNLYQDPAKMEAHFRIWHLSDPVDVAEQQRNQDIYNLQSNRNPFIDHPELVDRISSFFGTASHEDAPEIAVAPASVDMGTVCFNTTAHYYIAVVNSGSDTLHVSSIASTDVDFAVDRPGLTLAPETHEYVRITYVSGEVEVTDSTDILISSDDGDEGLSTIPVTIEVSDAAGIDVADSESWDFRLYQNRPNPFSVQTTISFELCDRADVDLAVYNIQGQCVMQLLEGNRLPPGLHRVGFSSRSLAPGVYFCRLTAGRLTATRRMVHIQP